MEIYTFGISGGSTNPVSAEINGGKAKGLIEMSKAGMPVPPGFNIPCSVGGQVVKNEISTKEIVKTCVPYVNKIISAMGYLPLLSVRSGARVSCPGMMDTILNVGLTKYNLADWSKRIGERNTLDCYRRLIQMYGQTVKGIDSLQFKYALKETMNSKYGQKKLPEKESKMGVLHLHKLIIKYMNIYEKACNEKFPQTLEAQLDGAINAVFKSWNSERAIEYRKINNIPDDWYTACTVQAMVFGNLGETSCSGVLFSRDSSTGDDDWTGEYLPNAQGEEVVAGTSTPLKLQEMCEWNPKLYADLAKLTLAIENQHRDMVDIEFTVQEGVLYILQSRVGKRSATAAFKIAYDLVKEGRITKEEALKRVTGEQYMILGRPTIDPSFKTKPVSVGLAGSKGIATGKVWFTSEKAKKNPGGILVSKETTPDDFPGMAASVGILTQTGGITSHAAVVARGMDKACVVGCTSMIVGSGIAFVKNAGESVTYTFKEGGVITIDGTTGSVWIGEVPMTAGIVPEYVNEMMSWSGNSLGKALKYDATKPEEIPANGEVFIDCQKLKNGLDVEIFIAWMSKHRPSVRGIMTFAEESLFDDSKFLNILGIQKFFKGASKNQLIGLVQFAAHTEYAKNWTVIGIDENHDIKNLKCNVHRKLNTLGDFLSCDGYYELTDKLISFLAQEGTSVEEFAEILRKSGKKNLKPLVKPVSKDQLAFSIFGGK